MGGGPTEAGAELPHGVGEGVTHGTLEEVLVVVVDVVGEVEVEVEVETSSSAAAAADPRTPSTG